jgi:ABC-type glycerol-3-phosphate transport system permease component
MAGIVIAVIRYQRIPWLALIIGGTFALYSAIKKTVHTDSVAAVFAETLVLAPFALALLVWMETQGTGAIGLLHGWQWVLIPLAGVVTTVPLMLFSAGIVPQYLNYLDTKAVFNAAGITDDKWLVVIAMGMAAMNIILLRNAFEGVPSEIEEAAVVDGATEFQVLSKVYIPMSKSTIATVALFFAISRWNGYFWARQMISNSNEHPLQVFIRLRLEYYTDPEAMAGWNAVYSSDSVIYALIVCSIVPILIIYPFIQKYFAKGVNAGGVKE